MLAPVFFPLRIIILVAVLVFPAASAGQGSAREPAVPPPLPTSRTQVPPASLQRAHAAPATSSGRVWFIEHEGKKNGPGSKERIQELVWRQKLGAETLVWRRGLPGWTRLDSIPELWQPAEYYLLKKGRETGPMPLVVAREQVRPNDMVRRGDQEGWHLPGELSELGLAGRERKLVGHRRKTIKPLLIAGIASFGGGFISSVVGGIIMADADDNDYWLLSAIPLAGPISCTLVFDDLSGAGTALLVLSSAFQAVGISLAIVGLVAKREPVYRWAARSSRTWSRHSVSPMLGEHQGLVLYGSF